eukprot:TRINITY_DN1909_c0_g1_i1.p1 TRINITY_DN1909_c0_g1~~TRINITY_DN1909_c0_g1_i1.p1  ORF type:complete len:378 (+),score=122.97 TRINITY_DN1909_c0_g1_i1:79-1212(+)
MRRNILFAAIFLVFCILLVKSERKEAPKWHQLEGYTFSEYKNHFSKEYSNKFEEKRRRAIFERNLKEVLKFNVEKNSWKKGINQFSDQTEEEMKKLRGISKGDLYHSKSNAFPIQDAAFVSTEGLVDLPDSVDWREKNVVTPVKNQGSCGSCWTFAAAESIESAYAIKTGKLQELSEQQILDCTPNPNECGGTGGCGGGTIQLAYGTLINTTGGLTSEWEYSYSSYYGENQQCKFDAGKMAIRATITSWVTLPSNKMGPVMKALATIGPLAINVDASAWGAYETGVFSGCNVTNPEIDHGVLLVGYGVDATSGPYWLIRNSWSPSFGESGYIRVKRDETCGTDINTKVGTICKGGPTTQRVCGHCGVLFDVSYPIVG